MQEETKQMVIVAIAIVLGIAITVSGLTIYHVQAVKARAEMVKIGMLNGYYETYVPGVGSTWVKGKEE